MKKYFKLGLFLLAISLYSCGGGEETGTAEEQALVNPNNPNNPNNSASSSEAEADATEADVPPSLQVDLVNKGVGPVTSINIPETIDQALADEGKAIYDQNCTACHKPDTRYIGPPQKDILERRTPEWVMNMIINPEVMVQEDPLAKALLIEFNGSPMSNQGITEEGARAILEYIRTM